MFVATHPLHLRSSAESGFALQIMTILHSHAPLGTRARAAPRRPDGSLQRLTETGPAANFLLASRVSVDIFAATVLMEDLR